MKVRHENQPLSQRRDVYRETSIIGPHGRPLLLVAGLMLTSAVGIYSCEFGLGNNENQAKSLAQELKNDGFDAEQPELNGSPKRMVLGVELDGGKCSATASFSIDYDFAGVVTDAHDYTISVMSKGSGLEDLEQIESFHVESAAELAQKIGPNPCDTYQNIQE